MDESRNRSHSLSADPVDESALSVYYAGSEECAPGHLWGGVRDHYLLHVIETGFGTFAGPGGEHMLGRGDLFLACPGELVRYRADERRPWTYHWIGFGGVAAGDVLKRVSLPHRSAVSSLRSPQMLRPLLEAHERLKAELRGGEERHFATVAALYAVLQLLAEGLGGVPPSEPGFDRPESAGPEFVGVESTRGEPGGAGSDSTGPTSDRVAVNDVPMHARTTTNRYLRATFEYIRKNFSRPMTIEEMAGHIGVSRKHLSAVVRRESGRTPRKLLAEFRLSTAERMLAETDLNVGDIARSCGYSDPLLFSRRFRNMFGYPPSAIRGRRPRAASHRPIE